MISATFWCWNVAEFFCKRLPVTIWGWNVAEAVSKLRPATIWGWNVAEAVCKLRSATILGWNVAEFVCKRLPVTIWGWNVAEAVCKLRSATIFGWNVAEFVCKLLPATIWGWNVAEFFCKRHPATIWGWNVAVKAELGGSRRLCGRQTGRGEAWIVTKGFVCSSAQRLASPFYGQTSNGCQTHAVVLRRLAALTRDPSSQRSTRPSPQLSLSRQSFIAEPVDSGYEDMLFCVNGHLRSRILDAMLFRQWYCALNSRGEYWLSTIYSEY